MSLTEMDQRIIIGGLLVLVGMILFVWYTNKTEQSKLHSVIDELRANYAKQIREIVDGQNNKFLEQTTKQIELQLTNMDIPKLTEQTA